MTGTTVWALLIFIAILGGIAAMNSSLLGVSGSEDAAQRLPSPPFSFLSLLAIGYPIFAVTSTAAPDATVGDALGAGLSALGDVLGFSAFFVGHFKILGLKSRRYTGLVAFAVWIVGLSLGSAPLTEALTRLR